MSNAECLSDLKVNISDPRPYICGFRSSQLNGSIYSPQCSYDGLAVLENDYKFDIVPLNLTDELASVCVNHYDCDSAHPYINAYLCCATAEFKNSSGFDIEYPTCIPRFQEGKNDTTSAVTVGLTCFSSEASYLLFKAVGVALTAFYLF